MKKGKVLSGGQIGMVAMVLVLAGAVWLNMKYSSSKETTKYMGETTLVDNQSTNAALVGAEVEEDYFSSAAADREASYKEAEDIIKEIDVNAFIIITSANEIVGEGYKSPYAERI